MLDRSAAEQYRHAQLAPLLVHPRPNGWIVPPEMIHTAWSPASADDKSGRSVRAILAPSRSRVEKLEESGRAWMADDAARIAQLEAELRQLREREAALVADAERRARALAAAEERQAATEEVLSAVGSSPTDLQHALDTIARSAARVCDEDNAAIRVVEGDHFVSAAAFGPVESDLGRRLPINRDTPSGRVILDRQTLQVEDMLAVAEREFPGRAALYRRIGFRTGIAVPMLRGDVAVGTIIIRRMVVRPFSDREIALLESFANQAAIVLENARMFDELERRNRELSE